MRQIICTTCEVTCFRIDKHFENENIEKITTTLEMATFAIKQQAPNNKLRRNERYNKDHKQQNIYI